MVHGMMNVYRGESRWVIYEFRLKTEIRQTATSFIKEKRYIVLTYYFILFSPKITFLYIHTHTHTDDATEIANIYRNDLYYLTLVKSVWQIKYYKGQTESRLFGVRS